MKRVIAFIAITTGALTVTAQREQNVIYLFDCTNSMIKNRVWRPAQNTLDATITTQSAIPGVQFTAIPFGDRPYADISFSASEYPDKKEDLTTAFNTYITQAKNTHITDVLNAGFAKTVAHKDNRIYLLTDGNPNGGDSPEKVAATIAAWCANHKNTRLFYVALVNGIINPVIQAAIDRCPDAFVVQCKNSVIPQIADISSDVYTNLAELGQPKEVSFNLPGTYKLNVEASDSLFNVVAANNCATDGKIMIMLKPKGDHNISSLHQILQGGDYEFKAILTCTDSSFFIANPELTIHVADGIPASLRLAQGQTALKADEVEWYDSFLWRRAAPDEYAKWDLTPTFRNYLTNSSVDMILSTADKDEVDYVAYFNGHALRTGEQFKVTPGEQAVLEVKFNHNAQPGKKYFELIPTDIQSLDIINDAPADKYTGVSLHTTYNVVWNPLQTLFVIGALLLLAMLILWLFLLKRIFFPAIKMSKIEIMGPGTYYASKKIKGARKVILTHKRMSQNIISRIFTGKIRFIRADIFSPELAILPSGGKKKVKIHSESPIDSWEFCPSSIFGQYEKGTITNRTNGERSEIEFS